MADGGQRLLDVIDDVLSSDPNALESFLGGLTSASDLLPSAESVDTVVASLAQLGADYGVDSPSETLFDTLDASNNLTDISQSYVPSDFDNQNVFSTLTNGVDSYQNGELEHSQLSMPQTTAPVTAAQTTHIQQSCSTLGTSESASDIIVDALVSSTLQRQFANSICDPTSAIAQTSSFIGDGQQQHLSQIQTQDQKKVGDVLDTGNGDIVCPASFTETFSQLVDIQCVQQQQSVTQNPSLPAVSSLSNRTDANGDLCNSSVSNCVSSVENVSRCELSGLDVLRTSNHLPSSLGISTTASSGNLISNVVSESSANSIVVSASEKTNSSIGTPQVTSNTVVAPLRQPQDVVIASLSNSVHVNHATVTSSAQQIKCEVTTSTANHNQSLQQSQASHQVQTQQAQQYIVNSGNIGQFVHQGQTVSLGGIGQQLLSSTANVVPNVLGGTQGTNLMQIQSANGQQQFIAIDQGSTPTLIATGGSTFGTTNLALVSTGGSPAYAVLPSGSQLFSNTIQVQPQQLQALKNSGQTFFQTPSGSIVAANGLQNLQNVQNVNIATGSNNLVLARGKQQPQQILPKPSSQHSATVTTASNAVQPNVSGTSVSNVASESASSQVLVSQVDLSASQGQSHQTQPSISVSVGQILQQQQIHTIQTSSNVVSSMSSAGISLAAQPTFTFSGANGIGQVVVSGVGNVAQPQVGSTLVLNQFGQPVLLPAAGASQSNGLQFILRQQPTQPQVLTIQTAAGATPQAAATKPIVRYVPQNQTVQIQQIQTPNGPAYIAVRCPSSANQATSQQFISTSTSHFQQSEALVQQSPLQTQQIKVESHIRPQTAASPQVVAHGSSSTSSITTQTTQVSSQINAPGHQQIFTSSPSQPHVTIKSEKIEQLPLQSYRSPNHVVVNNQRTPPSQIKVEQDTEKPTVQTTPKRKPSKKKKKVTLDLDEILKQSGIGDEDLQDDSCFENAIPSTPPALSYAPEPMSEYYQEPHVTQLNTTPVKPNGSFTGKTSNTPMNILQSPHVHILKPTTQAPKPKSSPKVVGGAGSTSSAKSKNSTPSANVDSKTTPKKSPVKRKSAPDKEAEPSVKAPAKKKNNSKVTNNCITAKDSISVSPAGSSKKVNSNASVTKAKSTNNNNNNSNFANKNASPTTKAPVTAKNSKKGSPKISVAKVPTPKTSPRTPVTKSLPPAASHTTASTAVNAGPAKSGPSSTSNGPPQNLQSNPVANVTQMLGPGQRIVQTIQLTPQSQQLLRNIQAQINRLVAMPKRNETEETALQKLIHLQQQVIASGIKAAANSANLNCSTLSVSGTSDVQPSMNSLQVHSALTTSNVQNDLTLSHSNMNSNLMNGTELTNIAGRKDNVVAIALNSTINPSAQFMRLQPSAPTQSSLKVSSNSSHYINTNTAYATNSTDGKAYIFATTSSIVPDSIRLQAKSILCKDNTALASVLSSQDFQSGLHQGQGLGGPTVVVIEDTKSAEQRRAAAKAEEEARARWRKEQFDFLLKRDQDVYVEPDCKTPFTSVEDAVERLMKYHLVRDRTEMDFEDFDEEFSDTAVRLLDKFSNMVHKYKSLMLKESMKEVNCAERVMIERTFCNEEKLKLEQDKLLVTQGEVLDLPPPPAEWIPKLKEMVDADIKEYEMDTTVNEQVQSAIDSIISCSSNDAESLPIADELESMDYDPFGISTGNTYGSMGPSSSADIDEAVRSILC